MNTKTKITDLPDYPAIKKLASALHRLDAHHHGAAIMIGAGFSRSAALHVGGEKRVPLWTEFTRGLARDLYVNEATLSFADPLRVAEEYRAYFGQGALNDKIRFEIDDEAWRVGPLYRSILTLPWSEVLTTNWDTLLERAAQEIHSPYYTTVTKTSDLAWAQSPRIVKLHGTIGVTDNFIAAQEDYRTYPERFAPFVNFARQVFIENELCLLGFSGDDPNFLQWAGWVRDHLANHARKVYLVGALNLSAARRKQLESTNVAPVDLFPAVAHISDPDLRHQEAITLFLQEMRNEEELRIKPHDWQPTSLLNNSAYPADHSRIYHDAEYGASLLASQLETLRQDRKSYPGWVVCPPSLRWRLANQVNSPFPNPKNLAALVSDDRARLLYEIAWRCATTFEQISPWLSDALFEVAQLDQPCALSERQQSEIALALLNNARWLQPADDDQQRIVDEHVEALIVIIEKHAFYLPDSAAEVAYHRALAARDRLDYDGLAGLVDSISGEDVIWKLRKAALLMELGRADEATELLALAYGNLRENHRRDRQSIPIMSRLLWAHWLLEAVQRGSLSEGSEELPSFVESTYRRWKCDPWSWLDALRAGIDNRQKEYLKRRNPIEPQFGQGRYRDRSNESPNVNDVSDFLLLDGLSRICGIPLRMDSRGIGIGLLADKATSLVLNGGTSDELLDLTLAIRAASSDTSPAVKDVFGRINVACLGPRVVDALVPRILSAVKYWQLERSKATKGGASLSKLRVLMEVLARLAVRVPPAQAKDLFVLATSMGQQPEMRHMWLLDALDSLLTNSLESIPKSNQSDVLLVALKFPLPQEIAGGDTLNWPNPVVKHPGARGASSIVDERIAQLIDAVRTGVGASKCAPLLRLLPLACEADFLTSVEQEKLANAVWGEAPVYAALPETGLLPHTLLILPTRDASRAEALVRSSLYDYSLEILENTQTELRRFPSPEINRAVSIHEGMASAAGDETTHLLPTVDQALSLFERLTTWRPAPEQGGLSDLAAAARRQLAESIGRALSYAITPALAAEAKTASRLRQLEAFYSEVDGARTTLPAFVYFASADARSAKTVEKMIASSLRGRDPIRVIYATFALRKWMDLPDSTSSTEFSKLISIAIGIIESGRTIALHQLLWLARELLSGNRLSDDQCVTLSEIVPEVFRAADYNNIEPNSEEAVTASTIRAECVKLAQALTQRFTDNEDLKELVVGSKADPLPEVRFASNSGH
ncbi:SIR2 family NAD-dependent protein deacylase [Paraburkholderia kururiensis]|uniref:SIR2 family protein n=1 Tax=Paraburkholderia kururiensis TaxID=984307 RepID=A0ABZ0WMM5_9BURK|nr:SIR2 family protein [Paraburkholderia kururiensis]WQD78620.1 SIR2 family protein [Paraburkholderia kururiensis]